MEALRSRKRISSPSSILCPKPSHRELEIISLLSEGHSSQEIAEMLHLSEHTISTHRKQIIKKTGARNTVETVAICIREGWIG